MMVQASLWPTPPATASRVPARAGAGGVGPWGLDTNTESAANLDAAPGGEAGEQGDPRAAARAKAQQNRAHRYRLSDAVARLLPGERVAHCRRFRVEHGVPQVSAVPVLKHNKDGTCGFGGLAVCSSVWACPVCSARIANARADELRGFLAHHLGRGGVALFVTRTIPHKYTDYLDSSLMYLTEGMRMAKANGTVKRLLKSLSYAGSIRALETTHGKNGWHPHVHEILLFDAPLGVPLKEVHAAMFAAWASALAKMGVEGASPDAFRVELVTSPEVGDYACKMAAWGPSDELARWHVKKSKGGSAPWQLLERYMGGDTQAGQLFRDYYECFKGRAALYWSKEARNRLEEYTMPATDAEIASSDTPEVDFDPQGNPIIETPQAGKPQEYTVLGAISWSDWKLVLKFQCRGEILSLAETAGWEAVEKFLSDLRNRRCVA